MWIDNLRSPQQRARVEAMRARLAQVRTAELVVVLHAGIVQMFHSRTLGGRLARDISTGSA